MLFSEGRAREITAIPVSRVEEVLENALEGRWVVGKDGRRESVKVCV